MAQVPGNLQNSDYRVQAVTGGKKKVDRTHWLYIAVIVAVVAGVAVGLLWPDFAKDLKWLGNVFIALIKMLIAPVIFCTIVIGIGSIAKAATVGKVGGLALGYFIVMSTFALAIGLVVGNLIQPGDSIHLVEATYTPPAGSEEGSGDFISSIIPATLVSALTSGNVLQALLVGLLCGFALQGMGPSGRPLLELIGHLQALVFRVLMMIMWVAPIGAFGAMAAVVGGTGWTAVGAMAMLMVAFYATCILFILVVLGSILWLTARVNILSFMKYLGREYLLIFATSSSESALPRLIAKMEHAGVSKPVAGIVVPTGYSFNLDGTAIYLTMSALFISEALGQPMALGEQVSLLVFMIIASKGAAGVTGAGLATLAAGVQAFKPALVDGVGFIVGIDRFMSEARALTNFTGNAVAAVVIGTWVKEVDHAQLHRTLSGESPFDEATMVGDHGHTEPAKGTTSIRVTRGESGTDTLNAVLLADGSDEQTTGGRPADAQKADAQNRTAPKPEA